MARRSVLPLLAFLVVLLVGCQRASSVVPPTPTLEPPVLPFSTFTPEIPTELLLLDLATATPSPSAAQPPVAAGMSGGELVALVERLAAESGPEYVVSELQARGYRIEPGALVREDLNGDESEEWIMLILPPLPTGSSAPWDGLFAIIEAPQDQRRWTIQEEAALPGSYRLAHSSTFGLGQGPMPSILTVRDISGDGQEDVLFRTTGCGSSDCMSEFWLMSYHGTETPRNLLRNGDDLGGMGMWNVSGAEWSLRDWNGDGQRELLILGDIRDRSDTGPQRGTVAIYQLGPDAPEMTWMGSARLPTNVRYFHLLDGDSLLRRELFREAIDVLDEVAHSFTLEESGWGTLGGGGAEGSPRDEQGDVRRFAYFRLIQAALLLGDRPLAAKYHVEMVEEWPAHPLTGLADYMLYADPTNFWVACEKAAAVARAIPDLTGAIADMGTTNLPFTSDDFCPVLSFGDAPPPLLPEIDYDPAILP